DGPISTPRRPAPRSIGTPMIFAFLLTPDHSPIAQNEWQLDALGRLASVKKRKRLRAQPRACWERTRLACWLPKKKEAAGAASSMLGAHAARVLASKKERGCGRSLEHAGSARGSRAGFQKRKRLRAQPRACWERTRLACWLPKKKEAAGAASSMLG